MHFRYYIYIYDQANSVMSSTCEGDDFEAKGQTGHFQSCTERELRITPKQAWIVETRRLQKSKERFGNILLINKNVAVHEITPKTTSFMM